MLHIANVQPTVLFRRDGDGLANVVEVAVENSSGSVLSDGRISFDFAGHPPVTRTLDPIPPGAGAYRKAPVCFRRMAHRRLCLRLSASPRIA